MSGVTHKAMQQHIPGIGSDVQGLGAGSLRGAFCSMMRAASANTSSDIMGGCSPSEMRGLLQRQRCSVRWPFTYLLSHILRCQGTFPVYVMLCRISFTVDRDHCAPLGGLIWQLSR